MGAEVAYALPQVALLAVLAVVAAVAPHALGALFGDAPGTGLSATRFAVTVGLTAYLWWYGLTLIGMWNVLASERSERRLVLYRTLPLGPWRLASARLLRLAVLPAAWGAVGLAALALGALLRGEQVAEPMAIVLLMVMAAALSGVAISTLLDLGGPRLVQAALVALGVSAVTALAVAPGFVATIAAAIASSMAWPTAVTGAVVVAAAIVVGNLVLQVRRPMDPS